MKPTALLAASLLLSACASPTAVIDTRDFQCAPGQDLGIAAGFEDGRSTEQLGQAAFLVEVSNNSHAEVTVTSVRVDPDQSNRLQYETAVDGTDVVVPEGEAHLFRLAARAPLAPDPGIARAPSIRARGPEFLAFSVAVKLTNGDQYRCGFRVRLE